MVQLSKVFTKITLLTLTISCDKDHFAKKTYPSTQNNYFTITHSAPKDTELVYVYLREKPQQIAWKLYQFSPFECIILHTSHFPKLEVRIGEGGFEFIPKTPVICGPSHKTQCQKGNYLIVDNSEYLDQYILSPTQNLNSSKTCINIEKWMLQKETS